MGAFDVLLPLLTCLLLSLYLASSFVLVTVPNLRTSPLPIFAALWLIFYLSYVFSVGELSFSGVYLLGILVMVNLGAYIGYRLPTPGHEKSLLADRLLWPRGIVWATLALGLVTNIYLIAVSGVDMASPRSLFALPDWYSRQRYQEGEGIPFPARIANAFIFAGAMIAALRFSECWQARRRIGWVALVPGLNLVLYGMIIGSKAPIIFAFIFYINGYFVVSLYHGMRPKVAWLFGGMIAVVAMAFSFAIIAQYFRAGGNLSVMDIVARIGTSYFLVPPALFMEWLSKTYYDIGMDFNFGIKTFQGLATYLVNDIGERGELGYVMLFGSEYHSSVYTLFRWIIADYGLLGAPLVAGAAAVAFGRAITRLAGGDIRAIVLFFFLGNMLMFSFAGSPYKYTTNVVAIILLYVYVFASTVLVRRHST